jgi:hypothetical protein
MQQNELAILFQLFLLQLVYDSSSNSALSSVQIQLSFS